MSKPSIALYVDAGFASPYAMSSYVALREKALPFELRTVDLAAGRQHDRDYAALSLTRRVPTLVDDGFSLSESSAIDEYLDERYPDGGTRLYPRDLRERARARQVQAWLRTDLMPIRQERSTEVIFVKPSDAPLSAEARAAADKLFALADRLLPAGAAHLFGDWSIADADLATMLQRLVSNGDAVPARLADYARTQWQRESIRAWVAQPRAGKPPR